MKAVSFAAFLFTSLASVVAALEPSLNCSSVEMTFLANSCAEAFPQLKSVHDSPIPNEVLEAACKQPICAEYFQNAAIGSCLVEGLPANTTCSTMLQSDESQVKSGRSLQSTTMKQLYCASDENLCRYNFDNGFSARCCCTKKASCGALASTSGTCPCYAGASSQYSVFPIVYCLPEYGVVCDYTWTGGAADTFCCCPLGTKCSLPKIWGTTCDCVRSTPSPTTIAPTTPPSTRPITTLPTTQSSTTAQPAATTRAPTPVPQVQNDIAPVTPNAAPKPSASVAKDSSYDSGGLSAGAIAGIITGCAALIGAIASLIIACRRRNPGDGYVNGDHQYL